MHSYLKIKLLSILISFQHKSKKGTFKKIEVTHYFDPETGLNVFFNRDTKKFISGWLLKDDKLENMINRVTIIFRLYKFVFYLTMLLHKVYIRLLN